MSTYHIRRRLARRGGSQFYKDRSIRHTSTFCGAEMTHFDLPWRDRTRAVRWSCEESGEHVPCARCVDLANGDKEMASGR